MNHLSAVTISIAMPADIPALVQLLNRAYRGQSSARGWTTEAHLISGEQRTSESALFELMNKAGSIFFKSIDENGRITGCVNLQQRENSLYLGMLCVDPELQGAGTGKKLLEKAELHAHESGCSLVEMTVISLRKELIGWYKRHGYTDTGKRIPFPEDDTSGKHLQQLEFMLLEKRLF